MLSQLWFALLRIFVYGRIFPKALRVLLVDDDAESAAETAAKLEAMDYIVFSYHNEKDAMEAISGKAENYHVAIVEVNTIRFHGNFSFLEMAKDLPIIVISNVHCFNTTMKCIVLAAAEFLQKPLSDDKLRNVWQHVVHKAFSAGGNPISKSLRLIKETKNEHNSSNDKYPAPSTPQLSKGERLEKNGNLEDQPECSDNEYAAEDKETVEMPNCVIYEAKFVDITCNNMTFALHCDEVPALKPEDLESKEQLDSAGKSNADASDDTKGPPSRTLSAHGVENEYDSEILKRKKSFIHGTSYLNGNEGRRRKMKVDWTSELHRRFVRAVKQLGIDQAIPSKILDLMKVDGLTRHNVASHLQKLRMHRRRILPKNDDKRWQVHRDFQKPTMAFPAYPTWPHPCYHLPHVQICGHSVMPTRHQPQSSWHWKTSHEVHADAWGYPVLPHHGYFQCYIPTQGTTMSYIGLDSPGDKKGNVFQGSYGVCQDEEIINEVVKEVMSKPWLPLPLGLKPPSTDGVLAELHRWGIHTVPPSSRHHS